mmetsp:Transcript_85128/g.260119  ORF Transcript_85128/g.260119 Transcript_85128/m.260119 type:complete len:339 (-) Transcript_85128:16-1032(-)
MRKTTINTSDAYSKTNAEDKPDLLHIPSTIMTIAWYSREISGQRPAVECSLTRSRRRSIFNMLSFQRSMNITAATTKTICRKLKKAKPGPKNGYHDEMATRTHATNTTTSAVALMKERSSSLAPQPTSARTAASNASLPTSCVKPERSGMYDIIVAPMIRAASLVPLLDRSLLANHAGSFEWNTSKESLADPKMKHMDQTNRPTRPPKPGSSLNSLAKKHCGTSWKMPRGRGGSSASSESLQLLLAGLTSGMGCWSRTLTSSPWRICACHTRHLFATWFAARQIASRNSGSSLDAEHRVLPKRDNNCGDATRPSSAQNTARSARAHAAVAVAKQREIR